MIDRYNDNTARPWRHYKDGAELAHDKEGWMVLWCARRKKKERNAIMINNNNNDSKLMQ